MLRKNYLGLITAATAVCVLSGVASAAERKGSKSSSDTARSITSSMRNQAGSGQHERLDRLIGADVRTSDGKSAGKLNNLVLDLESGRVLFAIVGMDGDKRVAVAPGMFSNVQRDSVQLKVGKDRLASAPKFEGKVTRDQVAQASFVNRVYQHFNQTPWWTGDSGPSHGSFNNVQAGENLMGTKVVNVQDKPMGEVRTAVIDLPAGRIVYVVLQPANDLDLGNKLYALPPSALTLHKNNKSLTSDLNKEKLRSAPSFERNNWPSLTDRSFAASVYQHYGKQAYFDSSARGGLTPTGQESERVYEQEPAGPSQWADRASEWLQDRKDGQDRQDDLDFNSRD